MSLTAGPGSPEQRALYGRRPHTYANKPMARRTPTRTRSVTQAEGEAAGNSWSRSSLLLRLPLQAATQQLGHDKTVSLHTTALASPAVGCATLIVTRAISAAAMAASASTCIYASSRACGTFAQTPRPRQSVPERPRTLADCRPGEDHLRRRGQHQTATEEVGCHAGDFTDHQTAARSVCRFLAGDGDDAVPDDRGTAADADLGDLAVLLAGSGVEQAGAVHGDALIDPQMKAAVSLW